ncbi:hypothetical protein CBOM_07905 [Ceraceosorus bombacis]|uniref:Uncharacterized protein n=1 Tax=Ceraceosorus bombacis TaxID=401625 RepID=A0A0P1BR80_9BASI|nr:hypothetical protein CBOM_07905 [Ceraceosorus bombacis]
MAALQPFFAAALTSGAHRTAHRIRLTATESKKAKMGLNFTLTSADVQDQAQPSLQQGLARFSLGVHVAHDAVLRLLEVV